jgi:AcrR family transcriptional regulator
MSKAKETKEKIIKQAAELFNQQGYAGSSISDIMRATRLQKGGIYNHFQSKQELALAAFDFATAQSSKRFLIAMKGKHNAVERLQAILSVFRSLVDNPPLAGGCPILNTAIESDDTNPALRDRVQKAMDTWRNLICRVINKGISQGEIRSNVEADTVASIMISTLEGAVMMSKLYGNPIHMERAINHLNEYIENQLRI